MKGQILLIPLTVLMLMTLIAPALATPPTKGTFNRFIVQVDINPGFEFQTGDIMHIRGAVSEAYYYGAPWGNTISNIGVATVNFNTVTVVGGAVLHTIEVYDSGTVKGSVNAKIIGAGPYTYQGPTFSFSVGGITGTVEHGATYIGGLIQGKATHHGVSGELKGLVFSEETNGVNIKVGPLAGVKGLESSGTYKLG